VARGSSPENPGRRVRVISLVYCIDSLFYYVFVLIVSCPYVTYFPTFMVRYSLFVLKVPLIKPQANKTNTVTAGIHIEASSVTVIGTLHLHDVDVVTDVRRRVRSERRLRLTTRVALLVMGHP